ADWFLRFEIPWEKLPTDLLYKLERPSPKQRREMIRLIINEVTGVCKRPSKKHLTDIARRIVAKYPKSLQDVIEGHIIITKKMMATYYTQRKDIIRGMETEKIRREWPFLFEMPGLQAHFRALTGVQLEGNFLRPVLAQIEVAKKDTKSKLPEMPGLVLLLLAYFGEDDKQMFFQVDDTCLPSEVPTSDLPASPCIIFCGMRFLLTASRLMLSIDKVVVTEQQTNFVEALLMMFASYYCLNIHYPSELGATLEFLQRYSI
ncbi:hypothetical protein HHUSO_G641, partial [Huso huso]